ncbi:MAG: electron transfer flavoprotein subunit beta/FixA family protein [Crocinitomicaceae bacterium]|nr:electron transfer flavoprotein subunit beta/FixA family protein [Crocinitomicaceae bacterium]
MKILVCISKVPDTTSKIAFTDGNTHFDENGVQFIVNPYDEWYALVRALEIKESLGGTVTIISVGGADYEPVIRKALAIGADDAVRINADESDSLYIARQIAAYSKDKSFDLVICGKETISYNGSVVPGMVAELLDVPYISLAVKLDVAGDMATVEREVPGGIEVIEAKLPLVLSAAKGMAEQRIPNMRGIMAARSKPLDVVEPVDATVTTSVKGYSLPPAKGAVKMIAPENAGELIRLLHEEAKVI